MFEVKRNPKDITKNRIYVGSGDVDFSILIHFSFQGQRKHN